VAEIGKICKNRGILFGVDAAQTAGVLPLNMQKDNIDFLCIAPHKGLYAPMGIGVLICRKPLKNTIIEGGTGTDSFNFLQPLDIPEGFESGTVNVPAIMGVGAGIDFVQKLTLERIYKHEFSLLEMLYKKLSKNEKIQLYTNTPCFNQNVAVLPFNLKDVDSYELSEFLNSKGVAVRSGMHCAPTAHKTIATPKKGACRVSLGVYNNYHEIEKFCEILSNKNINNFKKVIE
jgi:selenocysteine lyase/cysteine desulfurase